MCREIQTEWAEAGRASGPGWYFLAGDSGNYSPTFRRTFQRIPEWANVCLPEVQRIGTDTNRSVLLQ